VSARIDGSSRRCLLDSGADVSLIPQHYVRTPEWSTNPEKLRAANGTEISVVGRHATVVAIDRIRTNADFFVSPNVDEVILGRNWLAENSVHWDFAKSIIKIRGKSVSLNGPECDPPECRRCRVSRDIEVPPESEMILPTNVIYGRWASSTTSGQWTTVPSEPIRGLRVARTLIAKDTACAAIRVCNITKSPIRLQQGRSVSVLQNVEPVETNRADPPNEKSITEQHRDMLHRVDSSVSPEAKAELAALLRDYQDVFSYSEYDLGKTDLAKHDINTGDNKPFKQPLRPQPRAHLPVIDKLINDMQSQGVIEPCQSEWGSNIVLVKKKDGSVRFCVDYRRLNNLTQKDVYPLPRVETCLDTLSNAVWYSTFDLRSGFHQVPVNPRDVNKTTFVCHRGTYRFPKMPFGLCNAPATFQRLMDTVLSGLNLEICLAYLDDIIVFSTDLESHLTRLTQLFEKLREANLKLKPSKCCLLQKKVAFLGYVISQKGVETDPGKIEAIANWPVPTNLRQSRAFVGLCQYYRRFVPNFSEIAKPLHELTKKGVRFHWSDECQQAFDKLKSTLAGAPVLALPRDEGNFILDCDASETAIGAVLSQVQDGEERPICYASQLYNRHEKNYNVTRKELLAVVTFVKKFRQYLLGRPFTIRTDHAALRWLKHTPEPIGQQARWLEIMEEYDYSIVHRPGRLHSNADALSRREPASEPPAVNVMSAVQTAPIADDTPDDTPDWPSLQQNDPQIGFVYRLVQTGSHAPTTAELAPMGAEVKILCNQLDRLVITDRAILCREFTDHRTGRRFLQKIVPPSLRTEIAAQLHKGLNGGHLGTRRAKSQLQRRFFWPGWANHIRLAKRHCVQCARHHRPSAKHQGPLQPFSPGEPWERLGIDITGPHPTSAKGNRYILTAIDHFSKWVELYPMKNQEATTVARILFDNIICVHGCPLQILTDRGTNFESELFQQLCHLMKIDKVRTTAYQPSTNGQIERFHSTMHHMIAKWVIENQRNWDETLPAVAFAYRTSENEATGFTPFYLQYGREARIPADLVYGDVRGPEETQGDFAADRVDHLRAAFHLAREHLHAAARRRKQHYDLRARPQKFSVGARVWCLNPRPYKARYRKWQSPYCGPFEITRQLGPVTFEIRRNGNSKPWTVHIDKLKPYEAEAEPPAEEQPATEQSDPPSLTRPKRAVQRPARYQD